ncbi:MAG: pseudouridine synthase [Pseudomonadota bacterium]
MSKTFFVTIGAEPPQRLDKALSRDVPEEAGLSRTRLARLIGSGAVRREGIVLAEVKTPVKAGDVIEIQVPEDEPTDILPEDIALDVIHEDDALIVVNKPAGMVVHPAPGSPSGTLVNALLGRDGALSSVGGVARPGIVHRIDKDTSGLIVVARTDAAHAALARQFAAHTVIREYRAICFGVPDPAAPRLLGLRGVSAETGGTLKITSELARHKTDRQRQAVVWSGGRHAVTRFRVLRRLGKDGAAAMVACRLETGRTHQIRVHMAYIGHGLIGDPVYGGRRRLSDKTAGGTDAMGFPRQALHAATLGFRHPNTGAELSFEAPLPCDMSVLLDALCA